MLYQTFWTEFIGLGLVATTGLVLVFLDRVETIYISLVTELAKISAYERQFKGLCKVIRTHPTKSCALIPEQSKLIIGDRRSMEQLLLRGRNSKRRRLFDFVGEINSILWDTLAKSDGDFHNKQIDRLAKNQVKIIEEVQQLDELITYSILMAQQCKERFQFLV